jgi:hypothetical protein
MANVIKIKNSGTALSAPASLEYGEIAINYADQILFYKDSSNAIVSFDISGGVGVSELDVQVSDLEVSLAMQTF